MYFFVAFNRWSSLIYIVLFFFLLSFLAGFSRAGESQNQSEFFFRFKTF